LTVKAIATATSLERQIAAPVMPLPQFILARKIGNFRFRPKYDSLKTDELPGGLLRPLR
jgi:hypothetical protein